MMGILRLSQDLQPYAVSAHLGTLTQPATNIDTIDSLVIDGPSLVYHIFNRLLAYRASRSPVLDGGLPKYSEINQGFQYFLGDLEGCGVQIHHIFFDGGLPPSKHPLRLGRMEKVRVQLERYHMQHSLDPMIAARGEIQFEEALWNTPVMSTRKSTPPPPPFMVASVIEFLRASKWSQLVSVVLGEADSFCAEAARAGSAAVLTNDSDLAVHELGPNGSLALLGSIEKKSSGQGKGKTRLTILSLHPKAIADRLGVPSLVRFAFERDMDSSISTAMARERARDQSRLENLSAEFSEFAEQYMCLPSQTKPAAGFPLDDIDPRTAELIGSTADSPHIYLTPILEDPSRDSSWSYGSEIRQLVYSLLSWSRRPSRPMAVVEHARKGQRIASTTVSQFSRTQLEDQLRQMINTLEQAYTTHLETSHSPLDEDDRTSLLLNWYLLGANTVQHRLLALGKRPVRLSLLHDTIGLTKRRRGLPPRVTWDEIHFLGQVHAVLYSYRMLRQISEHVLRVKRQGQGQPRDPQTASSAEDGGGNPPRSTDSDRDSIQTLTQELSSKLKDMPPIADLFLSVSDLRSRFHSASD